MDMDRYIGRLLDNRYEILEVIGTGGMAVVYKARCHRLNRLVAIKILKDDYTQDEELRRRFHAESHAVAMLSHPNIVSIYDVSTADDADYIVMELIDGITLKQYMERKGVLNWKETLHFAIQIGKALEHAHSRGIIHRDIKPHNVMVLKNGSVKVTDFGIARVVSQSNTLTREALGSVHYISPEQAKGGRVSNCSDLYSLGVVMYEMMTGRPPYDGETPVSVAIQHINGKAAMPSTLNPNIPGGLEQIIMKAMAKEPGDRYLTAGAMLYDMDEFRKNPAILFDYNNPEADMDAAIRLGENARKQQTAAATTAAAATAAERTVAKKEAPKPRTEKPAAAKPAKKERYQEVIVEDKRERSSTVATIAVAICAVAAIVALVILGTSLIGDGELITVPNLVGLYEEDLHNRTEQLEFQVVDRVNDEKYEKGQIIHQTPAAHTQIAKGGKVTVTVSLGKASSNKKMENLINKDEATAKSFLTGTLGIAEDRIRVVTESNTEVEAGKIIKTEPAAGVIIGETQEIVLYISSGPDVIMESVPNVENLSIDKAITILRASGFKNVRHEPVPSSKERDTVVRQSVPANHKVDVNTEIVLQVSTGPSGQGGSSLPVIPEVDPDLKYKIVTVEIPENADFLEKYIVGIWLNGVVLEEQEVIEGAKSVQFEVSGKGIVTFTVDFNGLTRQQLEVNFDEDVSLDENVNIDG